MYFTFPWLTPHAADPIHFLCCFIFNMLAIFEVYLRVRPPLGEARHSAQMCPSCVPFRRYVGAIWHHLGVFLINFAAILLLVGASWHLLSHLGSLWDPLGAQRHQLERPRSTKVITRAINLDFLALPGMPWRQLFGTFSYLSGERWIFEN